MAEVTTVWGKNSVAVRSRRGLSGLHRGGAFSDLIGRLVMVLCVAVPFGAGGAHAAGDVEQGRELAERLCAVCHMNKGQGEKSGLMSTPSFQAIANRRAQDHAKIVAWLRSRPEMMPDHNVTWDEADALAAFIVSLRVAPDKDKAAAPK